MPERRTSKRSLLGAAASACVVLAAGLWCRARQRPVDSCAVAAAVAASLIIIVNALYLQTGSGPAPVFVNARPSSTNERLAPKREVAARPSRNDLPPPQPVAARRDDPIADLIGPSPRIAAVQRALSDFGYGQIKPSGMLDDATSTAIEKFQREHNLTITGEVSDRLVRQLAEMIGHPLQ